MKKLIPVLALLTVCTAVSLTPSSASAVPKLDIKVAVGVGSTTIVPRFPTADLYEGNDPANPGEYIGTVGGSNPATFPNWGMQLAARVTFDNKVFTELAAGFSRFYFNYGPQLQTFALWLGEDPAEVDRLAGQRIRMNQMEIPLTAGYRPYANPYFKIFVYGGLVNTFNIRGFVELDGRRKALKFRPRDVPGYKIAPYLAGARVGAQFDLGPLNFDFNYTIGINSLTKAEFRTNTHVFKFFLGWLF
ncbi:MAG: outer membrane beta-barrel protein [Myxococcales bacterium]|nr:outer membrane beta-barrel protein [Deltaproteobacteria bacterium]NNL24226.1 outer membrane beta-barrel protein [Myxococcales bacterium]